ncbi:CHAT domain-containing protein [Streptomyces sp. URMC 128]|uniref:CHAT domain-containing protein n=1 Tax=Streptomyces sp. URMC 128 TaxID=3423404 RepID=UPI003F53B58E
MITDEEAAEEAARLYCALAMEDRADRAVMPQLRSLARFYELREALVDGDDMLRAWVRTRHFYYRLYALDPEEVSEQFRSWLNDGGAQSDLWGCPPSVWAQEIRGNADLLVRPEKGGAPQGGDESAGGPEASVAVDELLLVAGTGALLVPPGHPQWAEMGAAYAYVRRALAELGEEQRLDEAITVLEDVVARLPEGDTRRRQYVAELGDCHRLRAEWDGDVGAAELAVGHLREAVGTGAIDTDEEVVDAVNLAVALVGLHNLSTDTDGDLLGEAEDVLCRARRCPGLSGTRRAMVLMNLASVLADRYGEHADICLLNESITMSREALDYAPDGSVERMRCQANLAITMVRLAETTSDTDLLSEADALLDEALSGARGPTAERAQITGALGAVRALLADGASVELFRDALDALRPRDPRRASALVNLAAAALHRYQRLGDVGSLAQHVDLLRQALRATPATSRQRSTPMLGLAQALLLSGTDESLAEGQQLLREVAETPWAKPSEISYAKARLGKILHDKFVTTRDKAVVELRAQAAMTADTALRDGYPLRDRTAAPGTVKAGHILRGRGDIALLQEAVATLRRSLEPPAEVLPVAQLAWLSGALLSLYHYTGDTAHLDEAVSLARRTASGRTADARNVAHLGYLLRVQQAADAGHGLLAEAADHSRRAATDTTAGFDTRVQASVEWARCERALGRSAEAAGAYAYALDLVEYAPWSGTDRDDTQRIPGSFIGLAGEAAAHAVERGEPERAVELLEQGRGVVLSHVLDARSAYHRVHAVDQELARDFADVQRKIERLASPGSVPSSLFEDGDALRALDATSERLAAVQERQQLTDRIRLLPGLGDFLRRPSFSTLRRAARGGPVVMLNVSPLRCDALLVTRSAVRVVPLPSVTEALASTYARRYAVGVRLLGEVGHTALQKSGREMVLATMQWLWDSVCAPVLGALGHTRRCTPEQAPRVWWCPTGPLVSLPLHSAGLHGTRQDTSPQTVLDRVVSSYTPTLRSLVAAYDSGASARSAEDRPLAVAATGPAAEDGFEVRGPRGPDVPEADVESFMAAFPQARLLTGPTATRQEVLAALPHASWAHFACHGETGGSGDSPFLKLYGSKLSAADLMDVSLERAEFAFLSACESSVTPGHLVDESLSMASAMQLAGFRHVIGTLWPISDAHANDVPRLLYAYLTAPGAGEPGISDTAVALHRSVLALRERYPHAQTMWGAYVHLGP